MLNKTQLRSDIETLLNNLLQLDNAQQQSEAIDRFRDDLSDAIENFVKSATVNVPGTGLVAPSGPVTGQATGTIT